MEMTKPAAPSYTPPDRPAYGTVIWMCDPRFLFCPDDHLYAFHQTGMHRDARRIEGHDFFRCDICKPASHFFVIFRKLPDPTATCYLISEACWKEWMASDEQFSSLEMLYLIRDPAGRSYNPSFRPLPG